MSDPATALDALTSDALQVSRRGSVATVVLNRPHRKNALTGQMFRDLRDIFQEIGRDDQVRVLVITGAGDAFCSGADLVDDDPTAGRHMARHMEAVNDGRLALQKLAQPTIAKVTGVAAGAGANLALGCDLVVASDTARFSQIFAKRGLSVDFGGSWVLPRLVGLHKAMELVLLADMLDAREAERIGLVNRVVPAAELDAFVDGWADRLAASPPIAVAASKRLLHHGATSSLEDALAAEGVAQTVNFTTRDTVEAFKAFIEKRDPEFEGR